MVVAKQLSSPAVTEPARLNELDRVELRVPRDERGGRSVPAGSDGTIVAVLKGGAAYIVEFERPFQALVTVEPADIVQIDAARA